MSLLILTSFVSSVSQFTRVIFVSGLFPNTASKLNSLVPIPCFAIFTFTVVLPKASCAGPFAGPPNGAINNFFTFGFCGTTSFALSFPFLEINSLSVFCTGSLEPSNPAAKAGLMVPNIITIASRKESNLDLLILFKFCLLILPSYLRSCFLSYSDCQFSCLIAACCCYLNSLTFF